jgi:hypothetical protein
MNLEKRGNEVLKSLKEQIQEVFQIHFGDDLKIESTINLNEKQSDEVARLQGLFEIELGEMHLTPHYTEVMAFILMEIQRNIIRGNGGAERPVVLEEYTDGKVILSVFTDYVIES